MDEMQRKIKEQFNRDYPIEKYGETAYKILMNDYVRMEFSEAELKFFNDLGLIDLDDPELQEILIKQNKEIPFGEPKDEVHKELLEDYQVYGFAAIKDQIENGEIEEGLEQKLREAIAEYKENVRQQEKDEKNIEKEINRNNEKFSLFEELVR